MEHFQRFASIGTHSLSYALRGIPRQPGTPLVLILPGITRSALEWSAVCRYLESEAPIFLYERSGYGRSEESPNEPDSLTIVDELCRLLKSAALEPPYLVVGHSWGGTLAREFVAARPIEDISGLVLVDAVQERMQFETWPDPSISAVSEGLDYFDVVGLTRDHQLTASEWSEYMNEQLSEKHVRQANREMPYLQVSRSVIAQKRQLEPGRNIFHGKPLSVLMGNSRRDMELMYEAGVANGRGTEAQRAAFRDYLATWDQSEDSFQREFLHMSTLTRLSVATKSGHNVPITEPQLIADEIRWALQNVPISFPVS
ncbi:uncharacterized protein N7484_005050 [Penicillium longicatenatum]|uniref:uncharacterized protein n=1 Tax=Penicillium longicatenatum TaxID=1561947 RepID=UPI0025480E86|nr:uncharacterized protein N7484_005050 [Penicillium longicatenatum]KAJ5651327.1 hypothetical protein N7484_005050 [Penicillium longicatenatum]